MAIYSNKGAVNLCEMGRLLFFEEVDFGPQGKRDALVAEVVMLPEALKALADIIYKSLEEHQQNQKEVNKTLS